MAQITREEVVTVATHQVNQYGAVEFTDTLGVSHKVGEKRSQEIKDAIIDGRAVKLGYSVYNNIEYLAEAILFDGQPSPQQAPPPTTTAPQTDVKPTQTLKQTERPREINGQAIGMTTKEVGDMIRAGRLANIFGVEAAENLVDWYRGEILGISRVSFDGKNFPKLFGE